MQIVAYGRAFRREGDHIFVVITDGDTCFCVPSAEYNGEAEGGMYELRDWVQSKINRGIEVFDEAIMRFPLSWVVDSDSWQCTKDIRPLMTDYVCGAG